MDQIWTDLDLILSTEQSFLPIIKWHFPIVLHTSGLILSKLIIKFCRVYSVNKNTQLAILVKGGSKKNAALIWVFSKPGPTPPTKHKLLPNTNCDQTQTVTKHKLQPNTSYDKTQIVTKHRLWQNTICDNTQIVTKYRLGTTVLNWPAIQYCTDLN